MRDGGGGPAAAPRVAPDPARGRVAAADVRVGPGGEASRGTGRPARVRPIRGPARRRVKRAASRRAAPRRAQSIPKKLSTK